ncbi:hypothetical protein KCH_04950 [Kitasatospora cheerisanensis KCTC 2395]|uniref:Uncharacterized protein n=1 Tax=Kitasatospora cheerisanensis KCTC 2395 TaxID=1348663 RepID=A0A066Z242_9ACTN|nr:hypothetical protein KCH_04950 [Kitasatospora cheerisanensis KCTC 2395]
MNGPGRSGSSASSADSASSLSRGSRPMPKSAPGAARGRRPRCCTGPLHQAQRHVDADAHHHDGQQDPGPERTFLLRLPIGHRGAPVHGVRGRAVPPAALRTYGRRGGPRSRAGCRSGVQRTAPREAHPACAATESR